MSNKSGPIHYCPWTTQITPCGKREVRKTSDWANVTCQKCLEHKPVVVKGNGGRLIIDGKGLWVEVTVEVGPDGDMCMTELKKEELKKAVASL